MQFYSTDPRDLFFDAARKGDIEYLSYMINNGQEINIQDGRGFTLLILACYERHSGAAELLIRSGADVNV